MYLYAIRDEIDFNPSYQRQGDIWPQSKKSLLIDSLLNGFDLPKIYFHEVNRKQDGRQIRYAVIDGKQRLEAIFSFLNGVFPVPNEFEDMAGIFGGFAGKFYKDFSSTNLKLKARFEALPLPVHVVKTNDLDLVEEMFSRLNEASTLNAAEKRNAFGGPVTSLIKDLADHEFFKQVIPFNNHRYRHYDVVAKLLLLAERGKITDTKRVHLDKFVKSYTSLGPDSVEGLRTRVSSYLDRLTTIFNQSDKLLKMVTMVPVYFALIMVLATRGIETAVTREQLLKFEEAKRSNRDLAQNDEESSLVNFDWLEFDRLTQSPNDSSSIEFKVNVLLEFLGVEPTANKVL